MKIGMHCRVLIIQVLNKSKHARIRDWTIEYRNTLIKIAYKCQLMKIFIKNWNIKFGKYFKRHDKKNERISNDSYGIEADIDVYSTCYTFFKRKRTL